jgi:hypothetical protein
VLRPIQRLHSELFLNSWRTTSGMSFSRDSSHWSMASTQFLARILASTSRCYNPGSPIVVRKP